MPLRLASCAYRVVKYYDETPDGAETGRLRLEWVPAPMPRARLVSRAIVSRDPAADLASIDIATTALVPRDLALPASEPGAAFVKSERPGEITVLTSVPARQLLVISESYRKGWKARYNGRLADVLPVYGDFLGVVVEPSMGEVTLRFEPDSLRYGKTVSLVGLAMTLALLLASVFPPRPWRTSGALQHAPGRSVHPDPALAPSRAWLLSAHAAAIMIGLLRLPCPLEPAMANLNRDEFRSGILGCWMGKNIGGTLGAPFEWVRQVNDVKFYAQDLKGEPLPNDDLDIQLLWVIALEETGVDVDAKRLAEYWSVYITPHWAEYGNAKANMRVGLVPPLSGSLNNPYKDSCGSFIRSEIWACIAPGNPRLAARFALEDAMIDHGDGEGAYAEVFCAALESAAFVVKDIRRLIDIGLSYIPSDCGIARAVEFAIASYDKGLSWREAREEMLKGFRGAQAAPARCPTKTSLKVTVMATSAGTPPPTSASSSSASSTAKATSTRPSPSPSTSARILIAPPRLPAPSSASSGASRASPRNG